MITDYYSETKLRSSNPFRMPACQMGDDRQFAAQSHVKIPQTPFFNSEVTEPIYITFSHEVEAFECHV